MGGIAKLLKDLKSRVESLEKKEQESANKEIQEIIDAQTVMDEIIVANADAIKRMEKEIMEIFTKKAMDKVIGDVIEKESSENDKVIKVKKKCRYFNHGFCKYKRVSGPIGGHFSYLMYHYFMMKLFKQMPLLCV